MLGFVIFGWPTKEKFVGTVTPGYCQHCQNTSMWDYIRTRRWVSLFFIPILPLGRPSYWLACDICGASVEMDRPTAREAKDLIPVTKERSQGDLGFEEYLREVEDFSPLVDEDDTVFTWAGVEKKGIQTVRPR